MRAGYLTLTVRERIANPRVMVNTMYWFESSSIRQCSDDEMVYMAGLEPAAREGLWVRVPL